MITGLYAGLLTIVYIGLSAWVIARRRELRLSMGDGGDAVLMRRIRLHGNFAEYAPFGLVLIGMAEIGGAGAAVIHLLGSALVLGRVLHVAGMRSPDAPGRYRVLGMMMTLTVLGLAACVNIVLFFL